MIKLKQVIHHEDTNSVEATWVDETTPAIEVPEAVAPDTLGEDGEFIPGAVTPAHTIPAVEVQIKCHFYADVQMDMFRADIAEFGGDIAEHEVLIALVESNIKPPVPPIADQINSEIWSQIRTMEQEQMLSRTMREVLLELPGASGKGWHAKVKKLDDDVLALKGALR